MKRLWLVAAAALQIAVAQTVFETASVKPNRSGTLGGRIRFLPGGGLSIVNAPLRLIVAAAFGVPAMGHPERVSGGPTWAGAERFDIQAKAPTEAMKGLAARARLERTQSMLRALLAERFRLTVRREGRDGPIYALTVARGGLKLRRSAFQDNACPDDESCHKVTGGQGLGLHGKAVDLSDVAAYLENWADRPVVNRTGVEGLFDIDTDGWASMYPPGVPPGPPLPVPGTASANDPVRPSLFTVLARVGLRLESSKGKVEVIVIESIERPSPN